MTNIESKQSVTHVLYALYAAAIFIGITGMIAVIVNYIKRSEVKGTWLESHFTWQIRTFWWTLLWSTVCLVLLYLNTHKSFFHINLVAFVAVAVWYIYRIAMGWVILGSGKDVYKTLESKKRNVSTDS